MCLDGRLFILPRPLVHVLLFRLSLQTVQTLRFHALNFHSTVLAFLSHLQRTTLWMISLRELKLAQVCDTHATEKLFLKLSGSHKLRVTASVSRRAGYFFECRMLLR